MVTQPVPGLRILGVYGVNSIGAVSFFAGCSNVGIPASVPPILQNMTQYDMMIYHMHSVQGGYSIAVSYSRLWKLLIDKKMSQADLRKTAGLALNTMTKLRRNEPVAMTVLEKICATLNVDFGDIIQYVRDES